MVTPQTRFLTRLSLLIALSGVGAFIKLNGVAVPWMLGFVPNPMGRGLFAALAVPLTMASAVNAVVAAAADRALARRWMAI